MILEWDVAEVLDYDRTYTHKDAAGNDRLFTLKVRSCSTKYNSKDFLYPKPANLSLKKLPLVGEFILMFKTLNEVSDHNNWRTQWYYLTTIDVHSSFNENQLPGVSANLTDSEIANIQPGKTFKRASVSPLQPYEGDVLFQSRFNSSIRLGSTVTTSELNNEYYSVLPNWISTTQSATNDPLIVLSNGRTAKKNKEFVVENPNTDASSLYLTSTQTIQLDLNKQLTEKFKTPNGSQFIGCADRIILSAKKDIAIVHSERAVIIQTPGEVLIGGDDATQPIPHGYVLENILQNIICAIQAGCTDAAGGIAITNGIADLQEAQRLLNTELNSKKYKIKLT